MRIGPPNGPKLTGLEPHAKWYRTRAAASCGSRSGAAPSHAARLDTCIRCAYTRGVSFEWDEEKRRLNLQKHRVEFADAVGALEDEDALTFRDDDSDEEDRFVTLGTDRLGRILVVVYTWRGDLVRVISARKATPRERRQYGER